MKLNLKKDLVVLDLETTGLSITKDKIIQIALYKLYKDGREPELKKRYINPDYPKRLCCRYLSNCRIEGSWCRCYSFNCRGS